MIKEYPVYVDLKKEKYTSINIKELDDIKLIVYITENSVAKNITGNTFILNVRRQDRTLVVQNNDMVITDGPNGILTITLNVDATRIPGDAAAELEITDTNGTISTATFHIYVDAKVTHSTSPSSNTVTATEQLQAAITDAETTKTELEQVISTADTTTYATKGEINSVNASLADVVHQNNSGLTSYAIDIARPDLSTKDTIRLNNWENAVGGNVTGYSIHAVNNGTGSLFGIAEDGGGIGIVLNNYVAGIGLNARNISTGKAIKMVNENAGIGMYLRGETGSTGIVLHVSGYGESSPIVLDHATTTKYGIQINAKAGTTKSSIVCVASGNNATLNAFEVFNTTTRTSINHNGLIKTMNGLQISPDASAVDLPLVVQNNNANAFGIQVNCNTNANKADLALIKIAGSGNALEVYDNATQNLYISHAGVINANGGITTNGGLGFTATVAGTGLKVKSPDGLITKTIGIDNTGALRIF